MIELLAAYAFVAGNILLFWAVGKLAAYLGDKYADYQDKRAGVSCPNFPHVSGIPCEHCD